MNELNITELDALKAQTDAVSAYAEQNVYNRLEEVRTQMRDRLRRCEEMRDSVCAYLRDNWEWILAHADYDSGDCHGNKFLGAKKAAYSLLIAHKSDDGNVHLETRHSLYVGVADQVKNWNWRKRYGRCGEGQNWVDLPGVDLHFALDCKPYELTQSNILQKEENLKWHEAYWLVVIPQLLRLLMKHCLDKANATIADFNAAMANAITDSATAEENAKKYAI